MDGAKTRRRERLDGEVAVGDAVERIGRRPVEAERLGRHRAVDRERGSSERGGAERAFIEAGAGIGEAAAVARDHLDIGEEMMAEGDRLRALKVGEARHGEAGMGEGLVGEGGLQRGQRRVDAVQPVADEELEVERDLVIARAGRVQAAGGIADQLLQPRLDVEMDVLERAREGEAALLDLSQDRV